MPTEPYPFFDFAVTVTFRNQEIKVSGFLQVLDVDCEDEDVMDIHQALRADGTELDLDSLEADEYNQLEDLAWEQYSQNRRNKNA